MQNIHDIFLLRGFDFFGQPNHIFLQGDNAVDITADCMNFLRVNFNDLCADQFYFIVGSLGDLIDKVSNGELCAFGENVADVFALNVVASFDTIENPGL